MAHHQAAGAETDAALWALCDAGAERDVHSDRGGVPGGGHGGLATQAVSARLLQQPGAAGPHDPQRDRHHAERVQRAGRGGGGGGPRAGHATATLGPEPAGSGHVGHRGRAAAASDPDAAQGEAGRRSGGRRGPQGRRDAHGRLHVREAQVQADSRRHQGRELGDVPAVRGGGRGAPLQPDVHAADVQRGVLARQPERAGHGGRRRLLERDLVLAASHSVLPDGRLWGQGGRARAVRGHDHAGGQRAVQVRRA
mmetsp:Transcript_4017/g.12865  ORF Transcript_4017/g.12865 Transcript_4017/m.12865 type:complete len:253 (+) Transcript_4017:448-1206(+)